MRILLSGNLDPDIQTLLMALRRLPNVMVDTRVLLQGQHDPLAGDVGSSPEILVHYLGGAPEAELRALANRPARGRPALLVVGQHGGDTPDIMRLAMQAGARDFLIYPPAQAELVEKIKVMIREAEPVTSQSCTLTAFISPKGGGGASMVAESVAHALKAKFGLSTLLMDLDCQFGTQYLNLDLRPDKGLKEALEAVDTLDDIALKGYVGQHPSGLDVIGTLPSQILLPGEITEKQLNRLMELLMGAYEQIVVDLPCSVDSTFGLIVDKMRHIVIVVQQDFQNIRNAQKLNHILRDELQVPSSRTAVVINRYEAKNSITVQDVEQALQLSVSGVIPSDYRSVNDAANLGLPLLEHAPGSPVSTSVLELAGWVVGHQPTSVAESRAGLWSRFRSALGGKKG
jgi:pilus assembly protein CpaE